MRVRQHISGLKTSNYSVAESDSYIGIGTLTSNITITLPSDPASGDEYVIKDVNGTVGAYTVTISGNGNNIDGSSSFIMAHSFSCTVITFTQGKWSVTVGYAGASNGSGFGVYGDRPVAGQAGCIYYATDVNMAYYDNGTSWQPLGPTEFYTGLAASDFTWQNQNSATATNVGSSVLLYAPSNGGGQNLRFFYKSAPSAPYTITAKLIHLGGFVNGNASIYGLGWGDGTKLCSLHANAGDSTFDVDVANWDSTTVANGNVYTNNDAAIANQLEWFRISDDGTNRTASISRDGVNFVQVYSVARTTFLTPTRVGVILNPFSGDQYTACVSWKVS